MRSIPAVVLALGLAAGAAHGQDRPQGPRQPPPDHWLTIDSLAAAVGLTDAQRPDFVKHYDALNAVMKKAADERRKIREEMGGAQPTAEQLQTMRAKFEFMQTDLDNHHKELRKLLAADQQAKFDSLPKPRAAFGGGRRPGG
jgi:ABC-type transporter Mla subunit MlaD